MGTPDLPLSARAPRALCTWLYPGRILRDWRTWICPGSHRTATVLSLPLCAVEHCPGLVSSGQCPTILVGRVTRVIS